MTLVLWDADFLAYAAGFSVQHTDRALIHKTADEAWELKAVVEDDAETFRAAQETMTGEVFTRVYLEDEALAKAIHNTRSMIRGAMDGIREAFPDEPLEFRFFLTGTGNFRDEVATIRPYKGNREKTQRPLLYGDLRRWLAGEYPTVTTYGWEADDIIATMASERRWKPIIVHVDKDLLQLPGRHFIPGKGGRTVSKQGSLAFFYRQMVTGDTADNIPGVYKAGAKRAEALVNKGMSEQEMWDAVLGEYQASIARYGEATGYGHMTAREAAIENARLLWLVRTGKGSPLWLPPDERQED